MLWKYNYLRPEKQPENKILTGHRHTGLTGTEIKRTRPQTEAKV